MIDFITQSKKLHKITDQFILADGNKIPCVGFGTWKVRDDENGEDIVKTAIDAGYRHFDTAALYKSEQSVGNGIKKSNINRDQFFITTKVWKSDLNSTAARASLENSLKNLGTEYVDLLLIHWPRNNNSCDWKKEIQETWHEFIKFKQEGKVRSIGVANFLAHHLEVIEWEELPVVNQIEYHIGYEQQLAVQKCRELNILVEAWAPLGQNRLINNNIIKEMAEKFGVTPAMFCLRYCLEQGILPLPKTVSLERMAENADIFDFDISKNDLNYIKELPQLGWSGEHPDIAIPQV